MAAMPSRRPLRWACALLLALPACSERPRLASVFDVQAPPSARVLTVTGSGRIAQTPGQVEFDCVVRVDAPAPDAAWTNGSARITQVTRALEGAGVLADDMQMREVSLTVPAPGTYRLEQHLRVLVRDLGKLPAVLAAALGAGATGIERARFGLSDPRAAADRARERALLAARDKAEMLAQEVNLRLGEVRSVVEQPPAPIGAAGTLEDPPGSLEAVSVVTVTYALLD